MRHWNSDDLRAIFDPVIGQIIRLVRLQIRDARQETGKDIIKVLATYLFNAGFLPRIGLLQIM